jgi:hypothetical protein
VKPGIRWNDTNYRQRTTAPHGLHGLEPLGQNGAGRFPPFEHRSLPQAIFRKFLPPNPHGKEFTKRIVGDMERVWRTS